MISPALWRSVVRSRSPLVYRKGSEKWILSKALCGVLTEVRSPVEFRIDKVHPGLTPGGAGEKGGVKNANSG